MKAWFESLQQREQLLVSVAAIVIVICGFYVFVYEPIIDGHAEADRRVASKLRMIADADRVLAERGGQSVTTVASGAPDSLTLVIANTANTNGLGSAYRSSSPTANDGIRVNFENAAFDDLVRWLGVLANAHGLTVDSARITDRRESGRVDASFTLQRG